MTKPNMSAEEGSHVIAFDGDMPHEDVEYDTMAGGDDARQARRRASATIFMRHAADLRKLRHECNNMSHIATARERALRAMYAYFSGSAKVRGHAVEKQYSRDGAAVTIC